MFDIGTIVITPPPSRKARHAPFGVVLSEPFLDGGVEVCAVGFFTRERGGWVRRVPTRDLTGGEVCSGSRKPTARSYMPEYRIWMAMRRRCSKPRNQSFHLYAGRVSVCTEWENFDRFLADVGPRPSSRHSLDRIDNEGNYEPGNVRWATPKQQARNTSRTQQVTAFGRTRALTAWAEDLGISPQSLRYRLKAGWPVEDAVSRPPQKHVPFRNSLQTSRRRGVANHFAKLDPVKVRAIRAEFKEGSSISEIARKYEVNAGTIRSVVHYLTWKHVKDKE